MYKTIEPGSWLRLESQGIATILPLRKTGSLSSSDRRLFFQKTAASQRFLNDLDSIKLGDGDIPVHVNAIGSAEYYGPNRKGDAFREQVCRDRHPTFVTEGRNYIHHKNRDPDYSFGKIAASCYNDAMHRIELLVLTNGNEAAARRNGGLVIPDEFLSKLEKNAELPVSMGCTIDHDICSICGNKARTRAEYCDENTCLNPKTGEYHPGCRHGLMKVAADGTQQYVYNVGPTFFDLSYVGMPADRTGYGFRADYLPHTFSKSASFDTGPARLLGLGPYSGWAFQYQREMSRMLAKLAAYEKECCGSPLDRALVHAMSVPQDESLGRKLAGMLAGTRTAALGLLAREGVLLSSENFCTAFSLGKTASVDLRRSGEKLYAATLGRYNGEEMLAGVLAALDETAHVKLAAAHMPVQAIRALVVTPGSLSASVVSGTIRSFQKDSQKIQKSASDSSCRHDLADAYALYSAAALCRFPLDLQEFGVKLAVWHTMGHGAF